MTDQEIRKLLNEVLKKLFFKILRLQERYVSASSNDTISRTEMHIIEIVQDTPKTTLTHIAEELGVTKATASVSVARLADKGCLEKAKSDKDKRKSILRLTEKGLQSYKKHQQFHEMMVQRLLDEFHIKNYPDVLTSLQALLVFFNSME